MLPVYEVSREDFLTARAEVPLTGAQDAGDERLVEQPAEPFGPLRADAAPRSSQPPSSRYPST